MNQPTVHSRERLRRAQAALVAGLTYWDALRSLEVEIAADREQVAGRDGEVEDSDLAGLMAMLDSPESVTLGHARLLLDELLHIQTPDDVVAEIMQS